MRKKSNFFVLVLIVSFVVSFSTLVRAEEPGRLIVSALDKAFLILSDPTLQAKDKWPERRERLWQEIAPFFDLKEMSQRSMGRYWRDRSDLEKREFQDAFREILKKAYLGKSDAYSGQKIVYRDESQKGKRATVHTAFIMETGVEVAVDFRLRYRNENWKIYDIIIEGVSLINNYRNQFNSILMRSSYKELMEKMIEKQAEEARL